MEPRVDTQTIGLVMGDDAPSGVSTQITTRQTQNVGMELDEQFHAAGQEPNMFIHGVSVPEHQLRLQQVCIFLVLQQWQRNPEKNAGKRQKPAPLACFERCCDGNRNANCGQAEGHWCTRESSKVGDSAVRSLSFLSSNDRALKMIKVDKKYTRALLSIWRVQWGKKPSLAELLEMNSFMCCHAEHLCASYCEAGGADSSRPAGAVGRAILPSARRALPLGEGKKVFSRSSTRR